MWWRRKHIVERVWIAEAVLHAIVAEAAEHAPLETGGMLLGYEGTDPAEAVITALVEPGPSAQHAHDGFTPDGQSQQAKLEGIYEDSGRITTYLGDWHSHPQTAPFPSRKDKRTARKVARAREARAARPLTIIAGSSDDDWLVAAYRLVGRAFRPLLIRRF